MEGVDDTQSRKQGQLRDKIFSSKSRLQIEGGMEIKESCVSWTAWENLGGYWRVSYRW